MLIKAYFFSSNTKLTLKHINTLIGCSFRATAAPTAFLISSVTGSQCRGETKAAPGLVGLEAPAKCELSSVALCYSSFTSCIFF